MQPDNQNTEQPDYSFITNQPGAAPPKKTDKKIILIIVLVIILAIMGVISVVLSNTQKSVKEETTSTADTNTIDIVEEFFKRAVANDIDGAHSLFVADSIITKEIFVSENVPFLNKMKLDECKAKNEESRTDDEGRTLKSYICFSKANNFEFEFEFTIVKDSDGSQKILYYILVVSDEE